MFRPLPDQETLLALIRYEPETGHLFFKERPQIWFRSKELADKWNDQYSGGRAFDHGTPAPQPESARS